MNKLLLVPSARLVPAELRADFGAIPSGMIPLNSKPALQHVIDYHAKECNRVAIGVHESAHTVRNYVSARPGLNAICVDVGETTTLGESVARVLRGQPVPETLTIHFADTLLDDRIEGEDVICYQELENVYRWTTFEINPDGRIRGVVDKDKAKTVTGKLPVFIGVFRFSRPARFIACLEQCLVDQEPGVDPFYSAVIEYFNSLLVAAKTFMPVADWKDLGHLDTYYSVKQQLFLNSRAFNSLNLDVRRGVIRKSSSNAEKLRNEIRWYLSLPKSLQYLVPRIFDHSLDLEHTFVEMEFYGYPALNDVYLHGDWDLGVWSQVLDAIGATLDGMSEKTALHLDASERRRALETMYIGKTKERLQTVFADPRFAAFTADTVNINGRDCAGAVRCLQETPQLAKRLGLTEPCDFTIIHGDLCLSNILYDRRSGVIRAIDPRGLFGNIFLYGDPRYELAKLSHSFEGDYDFLVNGLFDLDISGSSVTLTVADRRSHRNIKRLFHAWLLRRAGMNFWQVKLIESLLFFSMVPLHSDRPKSQLAFLTRAIEIFQEVLDNTDGQELPLRQGAFIKEDNVAHNSNHYGR